MAARTITREPRTITRMEEPFIVLKGEQLKAWVAMVAMEDPMPDAWIFLDALDGVPISPDLTEAILESLQLSDFKEPDMYRDMCLVYLFRAIPASPKLGSILADVLRIRGLTLARTQFLRRFLTEGGVLTQELADEYLSAYGRLPWLKRIMWYEASLLREARKVRNNPRFVA